MAKPDFFARFIQWIRKINPFGLIDKIPANHGKDCQKCNRSPLLTRFQLIALRPNPDHQGCIQAPDSAFDGETEHAPGGCIPGLEEPDVLTVSFLTSDSKSKGGKSRERGQLIRRQFDQSSQAKPDHGSRNHGPNRTAADCSSQAPAKRHGDGGDHQVRFREFHRIDFIIHFLLITHRQFTPGLFQYSSVCSEPSDLNISYFSNTVIARKTKGLAWSRLDPGF